MHESTWRYVVAGNYDLKNRAYDYITSWMTTREAYEEAGKMTHTHYQMWEYETKHAERHEMHQNELMQEDEQWQQQLKEEQAKKRSDWKETEANKKESQRRRRRCRKESERAEV